MDHSRFDDLARFFASRLNRRTLVVAFLGSTATALSPPAGGEPNRNALAADRDRKRCRKRRQRCRRQCGDFVRSPKRCGRCRNRGCPAGESCRRGRCRIDDRCRRILTNAGCTRDPALDRFACPPDTTDLSGANLRGCDLGNAILRFVNLNSANLRQANLTSATLAESDLRQADLTGADLTDVFGLSADLSEATLDQANLTDADLACVDLIDARLNGTNLTRTILDDGAGCGGVNLTRADLTNANATQADLDAADLSDVTWNNTVCPDGIDSGSGATATCCGHLNEAVPINGCP